MVVYGRMGDGGQFVRKLCVQTARTGFDWTRHCCDMDSIAVWRVCVCVCVCGVYMYVCGVFVCVWCVCVVCVCVCNEC